MNKINLYLRLMRACRPTAFLERLTFASIAVNGVNEFTVVWSELSSDALGCQIRGIKLYPEDQLWSN